MDQRKKLRLLDERIRGHTSPLDAVHLVPNNFANVKQKVNDLIFKHDKPDQMLQQQQMDWGEDELSANNASKQLVDSNGEIYQSDPQQLHLRQQFNFLTPPNKGKLDEISYCANQHLGSMNDDDRVLEENLKAEEEEEEDEEDEDLDLEDMDELNKRGTNEKQEESFGDMDHEKKSSIQMHSQSSCSQQSAESGEGSINERQVERAVNQMTEEPNLKKTRFLNSQKMLFTEDTEPGDLGNVLPSRAISFEADKKLDVKNGNRLGGGGGGGGFGMQSIPVGTSKSAQKFGAKRDKKISKITDYLNSDLQTTAKKGAEQLVSGNDQLFTNKLLKELSTKNQEIKSKDEQIKRLQQQLAMSQSASSNSKNSQNSPDPMMIRKIIQKQYVDNSQLNRKVLKIQLHQSKNRLGEYIIDGSNFREQWIDGFEVQDLCNQLKQVEKKIAMYQTAYQNLKNAKLKKPVKQTNSSLIGSNKQTQPLQQLMNFSGNFGEQASSSASQETALQMNLFEEESEFDLSGQQKLFPMSPAQIQDEHKRLSLFQISLLEKQREVIQTSLENKKREVKEIIKKYQLQYLEENSRFGGLSVEDPWPVLGNRYQLLSLLGKGGFSEVYKAIDLEEFREVAVKVHYIDKSWSNSTKQNYLKHAFREHGIQKELNHPNIVKLYDSIEIDNSSFASVLQFCDGPDLSQHLKVHSSMLEQDAKYIVKKILDCLAYLNSFQSKVIHYDLKPQNIIFNKGQIKITDFGLSKIIEDNATRLELTSQGVGTYWYLPPECFGCDEDQAPKISSKVDIWSVGVIFFEMIFGQKPFGNKMSQQQILQQNTILNSKEVRFPPKPVISKDCQSFILGCLKYNQEERFDIVQALAHPYFKKP